MKKRYFCLLLVIVSCLFLFWGCGLGDHEEKKDEKPKTVSVYVAETDEWLTATYDTQKHVLVIQTEGTLWDKEVGNYVLEGLYSAPEDGKQIYFGVENESTRARLSEGNAFMPGVRLYSKWKGSDYTVYFRDSANNGPMHFMSNGTIKWEYGAVKKKLPIPTRAVDLFGGRDNKPFAGWRNGDVLLTDEKGNIRPEYQRLLSSWRSYSEFGSGRIDLQPVYMDIFYRVTYVLGDGTKQYAHVKKGEAVDFESAPTQFLATSGIYGWSREQNGEVVSGDLVPEGDVTLYAQYRGYKTVRFYSNPETDISYDDRYQEYRVFEGESLDKPYSYNQYYASVTDTVPVSFPVAYDDIKPAYFKRAVLTGSSVTPTPCKIVYDTGDLDVGLGEISFVACTTFPLPTPTVSGYTFDGWYQNENFEGKRVIGVLSGEEGTPQRYNGYYLRLSDADGETLEFVSDATRITLWGKFTPVNEGGGV